MNYQQFLDYVMAQPADRTLDHSVGWCGCAIGEAYFHYHPEEEDPLISTFPGRPEMILETWRDESRIQLYRTLDENGYVTCDDRKNGWQGPRQLTTYGHLQDYIKFLGL